MLRSYWVFSVMGPQGRRAIPASPPLIISLLQPHGLPDCPQAHRTYYGLNTLRLPIPSRMIFKESTQLGLMHLIVPLILFYFKAPGSCKLYSVCVPPKFMLKLDSRHRVVSKQVHWGAGTEVSVFTEGHGNQGNSFAFCSSTM